MNKTYNRLRRLETFQERFRYLSLGGTVGVNTFGFDRWINQRFYHSQEWKSVREWVILRDEGCDLGVIGHEIHADLLVHHMNPITAEDIQHGDPTIFDPNYLITTCLTTHNAIHYGDEGLLPRGPVERKAGDTTLWLRDIDSHRTL